MAIVPAQRAHEHVRVAVAHFQPVLAAQPRGQCLGRRTVAAHPPLARQGLGQLARRIVQRGKAIAPCGKESARFPHRVARLRAVRSRRLGKRELLLGVSGVQPQESFGKGGIGCRNVGKVQGREVYVGEDRLARDRVQAARQLLAVVLRQCGDIDGVSGRQFKQQFRRYRTLVALHQRDIARGNIEIGGHVRLGQPQIAPHALEARPHEERLSRHCPPLSWLDPVASLQTYKHCL